MFGNLLEQNGPSAGPPSENVLVKVGGMSSLDALRFLVGKHP